MVKALSREYITDNELTNLSLRFLVCQSKEATACLAAQRRHLGR